MKHDLSPRSVYMFVFNNCKHDARVLKEAQSLAQAGYSVKIIALLDAETKPYEIRDGFEIIRVVKNPLHYRILRWVRRGKGLVRCLFARGRREIRWWTWWWKKLLLHLAKALNHLSPIKVSRFKGWGGKLSRQPTPGVKGFATLAVMLLSPISFARKAVFHIRRGVWWLLYKLWSVVYRALMGFLFLFHRPLSFLDFYIKAYRVVRTSPGDIYHAHDLNTLPVAWWAKKRLKGKLVYDSHELYSERNTLKPMHPLCKSLLTLTESFLIKQADAVITVSRGIADELAKRYHIQPPTVLMNVTNKVKSPREQGSTALRALLDIKTHQHLLLYVGGLTFNRGLEKVIESLPYLPNCCLVLMGYGKQSYKEKLNELAGEIGVAPRVFILDPVAADEVVQYAAGADLGIVPIENVCLSYYYCLPNKLFEYIAAGIPVAASDFPELRKIVIGHQLGEVFDPDDPKDIARAIDFILSDPARYQRMKENTRRAAQIYNWENESKKLLEIYAELTGEKT